MNTASDPSPTEIRARIEHTRAEMSDTIDAIQARLSPRRLVTEAKQSVKDVTSANRVPFAIAGAVATALAALAVVRSRTRSHRRSQRQRPAAPSPYPPRARSNRFGGNRQRMGVVMGTCAAGLACWGASRMKTGAVMPAPAPPPSL